MCTPYLQRRIRLRAAAAVAAMLDMTYNSKNIAAANESVKMLNNGDNLVHVSPTNKIALAANNMAVAAEETVDVAPEEKMDVAAEQPVKPCSPENMATRYKSVMLSNDEDNLVHVSATNKIAVTTDRIAVNIDNIAVNSEKITAAAGATDNAKFLTKMVSFVKKSVNGLLNSLVKDATPMLEHIDNASQIPNEAEAEVNIEEGWIDLDGFEYEISQG